jgi:6,7-dimethyl-8-ribityllumazine synthase
MTTRWIEGSLVVPKGARFGIVASRFNHFIVDRLVEGAVDALVRHGAQAQNVTVVRVPGAWELPLVARRLASSEKLDAVIALGAVIRGATPHFDYVAGEAAGGLAASANASAVPIVFGVLTTDTSAGTRAGRRGSLKARSAQDERGRTVGNHGRASFGP